MLIMPCYKQHQYGRQSRIDHCTNCNVGRLYAGWNRLHKECDSGTNPAKELENRHDRKGSALPSALVFRPAPSFMGWDQPGVDVD
jgi:hypothetical protein